MNWRKAPETVIQAFDAALPDDPAVQRRKMFGYPCAFVNGNMFAGLHQENIAVRLPEKRRSEAIASGVQQFEPMPGRPMREYIVVPPADYTNKTRLSAWLDEAFRFAAAMPIKEPKPRRARKA